MSLTRLLGIAFAGLIAAGSSAYASQASIQGQVKDVNGKLLKNATVKLEAAGGGKWNKSVKTDAQGRYVHTELNAGDTYRVSLVVDGKVKASINNVKTRGGASTELNFDLKKESANSQIAKSTAQPKKKTHMVYIPAQTGTHMGGRWVEVDDNGGYSSGQNIQRSGASAVFKAQSSSGAQSGGN